MTKKEAFVKLVEHAIGCMEVHPVIEGGMSEEQFNDAVAYFETFKTSGADTKKAKFTDNGKLILTVMRDNEAEKQNMFKAKEVAEFAFISSKSVSGSMRKLVNDGYVEKIGQDPIIYALTDLGRSVSFDE